MEDSRIGLAVAALPQERVPVPSVLRNWLELPSETGSVHVTLAATIALALNPTYRVDVRLANLKVFADFIVTLAPSVVRLAAPANTPPLLYWNSVVFPPGVPPPPPAELIHTLPVLVSTLPAVPGATAETAEVPFPRRTFPDGIVANPVPPPTGVSVP
jgi:hypothetical protein